MHLKFAKDYFLQSDDRVRALLLAAGVAISIIALVALMSAIGVWWAGFWAALTESNAVLFMASIKEFSLIVGAILIVNAVKDYLVGVLTIGWRKWLTDRFTLAYTEPGSHNYLELSRTAPHIDNPAQRIQDDVNTYVATSLSLAMNLFSATLTLAAFLATLWVVGGPFTCVFLGMNVTIHGYLVWAALAFAGLTSGLTHLIGRSLGRLSNYQKSLEANFRRAVDSMQNDAESIALARGEGYYRRTLLEKFQGICSNAYEIIKVNVKLTAFKSFYAQVSNIFPYVMAAPLYFAKKNTIGQLMQVGFAFEQVFASLSWFSDSYETLAQYHASVGRMAALEDAMEHTNPDATPERITVRPSEDDGIGVSDLSTARPMSTQLMMRKLSLMFTPGQNTLIKGRSGLGKSTLFKGIAGVWRYGDGEIAISEGKKCLFLPQNPALPEDTLKAILAFPYHADTCSDDDCISALRAVGGKSRHMDEFIDELHTVACWGKRLSGGEQQRISFARALLRKPDWLFLDESTASLDEASECELYQLLRTQLPGTTFISIAHRATVEKFHDRVVDLQTNDDGEMKPTDVGSSARVDSIASNDEIGDDSDRSCQSSPVV